LKDSFRNSSAGHRQPREFSRSDVQLPTHGIELELKDGNRRPTFGSPHCSIGRVAGLGVKSAPTSLSQRRMRTPWYHSAAISTRQRTLHAGIGVGEARASASEQVLYITYTPPSWLLLVPSAEPPRRAEQHPNLPDLFAER
jgi:hypothetical protein